MPELPEVETVAKALDRALQGRKLGKTVSLGRMRLPFDAAAATNRLRGKTILGVRRRAKYLIVDCGDGVGLLAHLGMTGRFRVDPAGVPPEKHDRVLFRLDRGEELRYADARRFGFVKLTALPADGGDPEELSGLGPEPLARRFGGRSLEERARGRKTPVKNFIMDQRVVAGVGNIYASEALFAARVDPRRASDNLTTEEWRRVAEEIKTVLRRAIRKGGSSIRSYRRPDGSEGGFQRKLSVYGRNGNACPACGTVVQVIRQGGRSTFFCPECQS